MHWSKLMAFNGETTIKKILPALAFLVLAAPSLYSSDPVRLPPPLSSSDRIEIPVRVYDGNRFVDTLGPEDFEILENGVPRKMESFALIREKERTSPRLFLLCLEMPEVPAGLGEAIDYFFENVPKENDLVFVQTPLDRWKFAIGPGGRAAGQKAAGELKKTLFDSLRKGGQNIRQRLMTLRDMAAFDGDEFMISWRARDIINEMINDLAINETQYLAIADYFQTFPGLKDLLILYSEEAYPVPSLFLESWRYMAAARQGAFGRDRIRSSFADAGLTFHFIFLSKHKNRAIDIELRSDGPAMRGDFFQAFRDLAVTTGGIAAATHDPVFGVKQAAGAAGDFYLLSFQPEAPSSDKSFKEIEVKVKKGGLKVFHRAGYIQK